MASQIETRHYRQPGSALPGLKPFLEVSARYLSVAAPADVPGDMPGSNAAADGACIEPGCLARRQPAPQARGMTL